MAATVAGTPTVTEQATGTTVTVTTPSGAASGEILVAAVEHSSTTPPATPSGWTLAGKAGPPGAQTVSVAVFYRVLSGTPAASYAFTVVSGAATAVLVRVAGADTTSPLDVPATLTSQGAVTTFAQASATTGAGDVLAITAMGLNGIAQNMTNPAQVTQVATSSGTGKRLHVVTEARPTQGAIGTRTWSTPGTNVVWVGVRVHLRSAGSGSGGAFELVPAGADESAVATNAAVYDTVSGDVKYDTAFTFKDLTAAVRFVNPSATAATGDQTLPAAVAARYLVRVWRTQAFTSGTSTTLLQLRSAANAALGSIRLTSAGQLQLRNAAGTTLATHAITAGSPFRFEWDIDGVSQWLRVYNDPQSPGPSAVYGPFDYTDGPFQHLVDGVSATGATTAHLLYAADGDTVNPSLNRWNTPGSGTGYRSYVAFGGSKYLTTTSI